MESLNDKLKEAKLSYPREWGFKIIGRDKEKLKEAIKEIMGDRKHLSSSGNSSKNGKFHSYNASCEVKDAKERDELFKAFSEHKDIDMVI